MGGYMKKIYVLLFLIVITITGCSGNGSSPTFSGNKSALNTPTELTVTASDASSITLAWKAPLNSSGSVLEYKIYRDGIYIGSTSSSDQLVTYTDTNLPAARVYIYSVCSNSQLYGDSDLSLSTAGKTPLPPAGNLTAINTTLFSFKFSWSAPAGLTDSVSSYKIYRNGTLFAINAPADTNYNDSSLIPETSYTYTVVASSQYVGDSISSPAITATTLSPGTTPASPVNGVITDPQTGASLANVTVTAYVQSTNTLVSQTTTDANGEFSFTGLIVGKTYYLSFSIPGYDTAITYYNIIPRTNAADPSASPLFLQPVRMIQSALAGQTSTLSGKVKNSTNNSGLASMTVKLRDGIGAENGIVRATSTTDSTGTFSFANLPLGTYTAEVTGLINGTAIVTTYATLLNYTNYRNADIAVSLPIFAANGSPQYRIILGWASDPSDLDSHLTGPTTLGTRFHIYYVNRSWPLNSAPTPGSTITEAFLDVDNVIHGMLPTSDNGPETTTILKPMIGTYAFYVHHFAGAGNITSAAATVNIYKGNQLLRTFYAPTGATGVSNVWNVFQMAITDINTETIIPVGTITNTPTSTLF